MDDDISIRKAVTADIGPIKEILFAALQDFDIAVPDNYSVSDIDYILATDTSGHLFVLLRQKIVIGFVALIKISSDLLELKRLYLSSAERGKGLGAYFLEFAIGFAQKNKYKSIQLETTSRFKAAVALYQKHGFTTAIGVKKAPGHDLAFIKHV